MVGYAYHGERLHMTASANLRHTILTERANTRMDIADASLLFREKILAMDKNWRPATKRTRLVGLQAR